MQIKDIKTGETYNTDEMPNIQAEISECVGKLHDVCIKYNIPFSVIVSIKVKNGDKMGDGICSINFPSKEKTAAVFSLINGMIKDFDLPYTLYKH